MSIKMSNQELGTNTIKIPSSSFICSVVFLANGKYIAGGGYDGRIRRWLVEDGQEVGAPMNVGQGVLNLAASNDGKWIVSATDGGLMTVWDAETHFKLMEFGAHPGFPIEALDMSPMDDGRTRIATGSHDSTACVWSLNQTSGERLVGPLQHESTLASVKYSPDGRFLATATCDSHAVRVYHSEDGRLLANVPVMVDAFDQSLVWSRNSRHLFALSEGKIKCLDAWSGTTLSEWPIHSGTDPRGIAMLPSNSRFIAVSANSSISFWDTVTHSQIGPVLECEDVLFSIAVSSNYDFVTSGIKSTVLRSLRDVLPPECFIQVPTESEVLHVAGEHDANIEETVRSLCTEIRHLRAQQESSQQTLVKLEETVQGLHAELVESRRRADQQSNDLGMVIESLRSDLRAAWTERKYTRHAHHSRLAAAAKQEGGASRIASNVLIM